MYDGLFSFEGAGFGITNGALVLHKHLGIDLREINTPVKTTQVRTHLGETLGVIDLQDMFSRWDPNWEGFAGTGTSILDIFSTSQFSGMNLFIFLLIPCLRVCNVKPGPQTSR